MDSSRLTYGVLGPLEIRRDGDPVRLPSPRQRAVLAALLVRCGRPVPGDVLIAAAWGEELPANPRPALHTLISRLRAQVGADTITAEPVGYRLLAGPDAVDAHRFQAWHRQAREAPAPYARGLLERGLAMWRGSAYAEFADRDFASAEAVRLDELRLTGLEDLAEVQLELGEATTALPTLEALVAEHPLRERARGLLMTARYRAGRVTAALDAYQQYRKVLAEELGLDPSPALRDLHRRLLSHQVSADPPARVGAEPVARAATEPPARMITEPVGGPRPVTDADFLGREDDVALLIRLATEHRLVTVTGAGGVGKTRLVSETCQTLAGQLTVPATVVRLAGVDDDRVDLAIATGLGIGPVSGDAREAVLDYLSVIPALLILDNCEHVLPRVRGFVQLALRRCPGLRIVATSRQRLGIAAEQVLPLEPLATAPADSPEAALTAAVRLFADRARRVRPGFTLTDALVPAVAELCRRLDGLPLAIELAATRAATLGVEALRERLDSSLDLLTEGGPAGERSLRAVLDWSYRLLDQADQTLLAGLSVFEEEFDLDSAERVVAGLTDRPVAVGLARLVDASLVAAQGTGGTARYRLSHLVRTFARDRLAESGTEPATRAAHARWVQAAVRSAARAARGPGDMAAAGDVNAIAGSVHTAVAWALREGQPALAGEIAKGLMLLASARWQLGTDLVEVVRQVARHPAIPRTSAAPCAAAADALAATQVGDLEVGERAARAALGADTDADARCLALLALGIVTLYRGDHDRSRRTWEELLAIPELPPVHLANCHASLALIACYDGAIPEAHQHAARATAAAEAAGAEAGHAFVTYVAAEVTVAEDLAAAVPLLVSAATEADRAGVDFTAGLAGTALLAALTRLERTAEALEVIGPLLERWLRLAAWPQIWTTLRTFAELLAGNGQPEEAALLLTAADQAPSAPAIAGTHAVRYRRLTERVREQVSTRAYERIVVLAGLLPRTAVVERARAAVTDLYAR